MEPSSAPVATSDVHEEDLELIERLAKLQQMHQQIFDLRTLLPDKLLGPARESMREPRKTSPKVLANTVSSAARKGASDIRQFKKDWHDEKTKELFQKASAAETPQGVDAWKADYASLLSSHQDQPGPNSKSQVTEDASNLSHIIETFKQNNSGITLSVNSEQDPFPVSLEVAGLGFEVRKDDASSAFSVTPKSGSDNTKLVQRIAHHVNESDLRTNLGSFLNMIAAYQDLRTRSCDKCKELYDRDLELPTIRTPRGTPSSSGSESSDWMALHPTCT